MNLDKAINQIIEVFGEHIRKTKKVIAWQLRSDLEMVVQTDAPQNEEHMIIWLPYYFKTDLIPTNYIEYEAEQGRHSNTYPSVGLERGKPALKLIVDSDKVLDETLTFIRESEKQ